MTDRRSHEWSRDGRRICAVLIVVAGATYALAVWRYLPSPIRFDETSWALQAGAIQRHGVPKLPFAEDRSIWIRPPYPGYDAFYGMWHPPVYEYSLAAWGLVFGLSAPALRSAGLAWFVLTLALVWRITVRAVPGEVHSMTPAVAVGLSLLSPLVADGSLLLDIDNTSLSCSLMLFAYAFLRRQDEGSPRSIIVLAAVFAFCLASKLTTPFVMLPAIAIYQALRKRVWLGLVQAVAIGLAGGTLFLAAYSLYCWAFDYPFWFMFDMVYRDRLAAVIAFPLRDILFAARWYVLWASPPIVLLVALTVWSRWRRLREGEVPGDADFLLLFALMTAAAYVFGARVWGKYLVPALIAAAIPVGIELVAALKSVRPRWGTLPVSAFGGLIALHLFVVPPLQLRAAQIDVQQITWSRAVSDSRNLYLGISAASGLAMAWVLRSWGAPGRLPSAAWAGLAMYLLAANPLAAGRLLLSTDDRSPYRPFRERGFTQVVTYLNANVGPRAAILAPKDIGFYFKGRFYPLERTAAVHGLDATLDLVRRSAVAVVVDSSAFPAVPEFEDLRRQGELVVVATIGDFVVYAPPNNPG